MDNDKKPKAPAYQKLTTDKPSQSSENPVGHPNSSPIAWMNLPILRPMIDEMERNIQAPLGLILYTVLAALSLVCQGLIDVQIPCLANPVPAVLYILVLAKSGERKSAVQSILFRTISAFDARQAAAYEESVRHYKAALQVWKVRRSKLDRDMQRALNEGECIDHLEEELRFLLSECPAKPRKFKLIYEDVTQPALLSGLYENLNYAGLISSEARGVINGAVFKDPSPMCALWSGSNYTVDRKSGESFVLRNSRLTLLLMVQLGAFDYFMDRRGDMAKDSGLLARMLIGDAGSTQGFRFIGSATQSWQHINPYEARMNALLDEFKAVEQGEPVARKVIKLSAEAEAAWMAMYNKIEGETKPGGRYANAGDHASKLSENVVRLAALLHHFEGFEGDVSKETLDAAFFICDDASKDYVRIFVPLPQEEQDALLLDKWFTDRFRDLGERYVEKVYARQYGPNALRNSRFYTALDLLVMKKKVSINKGLNFKEMIDLDPQPYRSSPRNIPPVY